MTKQQDISQIVSKVLLNNQHLLTKAFFTAQLYIAELEKELGYKRDSPNSAKAQDYYVAAELLHRSEWASGLQTEQFPKPTFAPWHPNGLLDKVTDRQLGSYRIIEGDT